MHDEKNIEMARHLAEAHSGHRPHEASTADMLEVVEAVVLALVTVATAWSGYQSAQWDGQQSQLYASAEQLRIEAAVAGGDGRQRLLFDALMLNAWIAAKSRNESVVVDLYERRFSPEFRVAFDAWLKTDPLKDPRAPAGPFSMPQYHNPGLAKADQLSKEASAAFAQGNQAREVSDRYVRITVLLAAILFLTAISQRFRIRRIRIGLIAVAVVLMIYAIGTVATFPRM